MILYLFLCLSLLYSQAHFNLECLSLSLSVLPQVRAHQLVLPPCEVVIKAVSEYVASIKDLGNLDAVARDVFKQSQVPPPPPLASPPSLPNTQFSLHYNDKLWLAENDTHNWQSNNNHTAESEWEMGLLLSLCPHVECATGDHTKTVYHIRGI